MQSSKPDTHERDTSSSLTTLNGGNKTTAGVSRYAYSDVLYIVGLATMGQGIVFLGAPMFLEYITVLPNDPFTLIGTMYAAMGIAFLIISKLFNRSAENCSGTCTRNCFFGKWKSSAKQQGTTCHSSADTPHDTDDKDTTDEQCCNNGQSEKQDTPAADNNDIPEVEDTTVRNRKRKETNDQQWDIVDSVGDVQSSNQSRDNKLTIQLGCDSAVILKSK